MPSLSDYLNSIYQERNRSKNSAVLDLNRLKFANYDEVKEFLLNLNTNKLAIATEFISYPPAHLNLLNISQIDELTLKAMKYFGNKVIVCLAPNEIDQYGYPEYIRQATHDFFNRIGFTADKEWIAIVNPYNPILRGFLIEVFTARTGKAYLELLISNLENRGDNQTEIYLLGKRIYPKRTK